MKKSLKLISILTISLSLLIPSTVLASSQTDHNYTSIMKATNSQLTPKNQYLTTLLDENGEQWEVILDENQTGQWYNAHLTDHATPDYIYDDEIFALDWLSDTSPLK